MSLLKGNYKLDELPATASTEASPEQLLEQDYYKAALAKLGGSIAFIMKGKTFLWTGVDNAGQASAPAPAKKDKA